MPRSAATIVLYRVDPRARCGFRVFMVRRSRKSRFMPGAHVFPGGTVDDEDREVEALERLGVEPSEATRRFRGAVDGATALTLLHAGIRELSEEAGLELSHAADLMPFAHWITPLEEPRRFDTWFLVAKLPEGADPGHDDYEVHDSRWIDPAQAIDDYGDGDMLLAPPTFHTLWDLSRFGSLQGFLEDVALRPIPPIQPRMRRDDAGLSFLLPGDVDHQATESMPGPTRIILGADGRWVMQEHRGQRLE